MNRSILLLALLGLPATGVTHEMPSPAAVQHGHSDYSVAQAARTWTHYPLLVRNMNPGVKGRNEVLMGARNFQPELMQAYSPDGAAPRALELSLGGARIEALPGVGNYYWVTAREALPDRVIVASTTHYFSNPGPAPTTLLRASKNELEIIPQPLPREHSGYRSNETWRFLVRYNGAPLANQPLTLETQNGSRATFISDAEGYARVKFPDDFKADADSGSGQSHGPRRLPFVLASEHHGGDRHYLTAFNGMYGPDAYAGRDLALGVGFTLLGMALAVPLLLNRTLIERAGAGNRRES